MRSTTSWSPGATGRWERVYPVVFIDAIVVKIRDGAVANRPVYGVVGVNLNGERDVLGL
jgi:transposase-like protein